MEDLEAFLIDFARAHPDEFVVRTAVAPDATSFAVASALRVVESPAADERFLALLGGRDGSLRWLALGALLERGSLAARARLPELLADRDGLVVFAAARALRRWGGVDVLPKLRALVRAKRTAPGTREAAYDAIEAISARASRPLPRGSPPPRLLEVALGAGAKVMVVDAQLVERGAVLARASKRTILAPERAVVIDVEDRVVLLRRVR
jgi:hypothetical protein